MQVIDNERKDHPHRAITNQIADVVVIAIANALLVAYVTHFIHPAPHCSGVLLGKHCVKAEPAKSLANEGTALR
ncbi:hypothetical protein D3C84_1093080 [compost metagenome]